MPCCGRQNMPAAGSRPPESPVGIIFQNVGATALTALGAATGSRYRFAEPGAVLAVDVRDEASLRVIPYLRQIYGGY